MCSNDIAEFIRGDLLSFFRASSRRIRDGVGARLISLDVTSARGAKGSLDDHGRAFRMARVALGATAWKKGDSTSRED